MTYLLQNRANAPITPKLKVGFYVLYTENPSNDIAYSLKNLNFKKAAGLDYISEEVFKLIHEETKNNKAERDEFTENLAILCNQQLGN